MLGEERGRTQPHGADWRLELFLGDLLLDLLDVLAHARLVLLGELLVSSPLGGCLGLFSRWC